MNPSILFHRCSIKAVVRACSLITLVVATHLIHAAPTSAAQATLAWDPPSAYADGTPLTTLKGYKVHIGTTSGSYTQSIDVGNQTTYKVSNLADGTNYYFTVSAYDAAGQESPFSNEMHKTTAVPPPPTSYSITGSAGTGGSISPGSATVVAGGSQSFAITPASGYQVASVTVDGSPVGAVNSYTFSNVNSSHTIAASFAQIKYTITASAGAGGSISPTGTVTADSGTSKAFSIVVASGYNIQDVKVDGVSVGAVASYTFSGLSANHTIQASFVARAGILKAAIDCGGASYVDASGISYRADALYSGGSLNKISGAIAGTTDQGLYQTWRYGTNFAYNLPLANGNYLVTLKFSENFATKVGQRVFSVLAQGSYVLRNLDIYAKVGTYKAYDVIIPVKVSNGVLKLNFAGTAGNAIINGIVVKSN